MTSANILEGVGGKNGRLTAQSVMYIYYTLHTTICPISSYPILYSNLYCIKWVTILLGHTVYMLVITLGLTIEKELRVGAIEGGGNWA